MKLLYHWLIKRSKNADLISGAIVFDASPFYNTADDRNLNLAGLPITPPYERLFVEFGTRQERWGVFIQSDQSDMPMTCECHVFAGRQSRVWKLPIRFTMTLGDDGTFSREDIVMHIDDVALPNDYQHGAIEILRVGLFSIALTHARNIELVDKPPTTRKRTKTRDKPDVEVKTLRIKPFGTRYESTANSGGEPFTRMHLCRGHFRDYREGPGLFGKYHQLVWVTAHVKGNRASGKIEKDYEIGSDAN